MPKRKHNTMIGIKQSKESRDDLNDSLKSIFRFETEQEFDLFFTNLSLYQTQRLFVLKDQCENNLYRLNTKEIKVIGKGQNKIVYLFEDLNTRHTYAGFFCHPIHAAYHIIMCGISNNFIEFCGYDNDTRKLYVEILTDPIGLFYQRRDPNSKRQQPNGNEYYKSSREGLLDHSMAFKICVQLFLSGSIVDHLLGASISEWTPSTNIGIRREQEGFDMDYSILAPILRLDTISIRINDRESIPVLYDYWMTESVFHNRCKNKNESKNLKGIRDRQLSFFDPRIRSRKGLNIQWAMSYAYDYVIPEQRSCLHDTFERYFPSRDIREEKNHLYLFERFLKREPPDWLIFREREWKNPKDIYSHIVLHREMPQRSETPKDNISIE